MSPATALALSIVVGIVPSIIWLFFWLREDKLHPEPKRYIFLTFILGMIAVPLVIPFEHAATTLLLDSTMIIIAWATIEEVAKFVAAYIGGVHRKIMDEPIDALIYLITPALGFAALENLFFVLNPFGEGEVLIGLATGNMRFIGATLLHTVSSAAIGAAIALSFHKTERMQIFYVVIGLAVAITLHALFNSFIITASPMGLLAMLGVVWVAVIGLILFFEKVKRLT